MLDNAAVKHENVSRFPDRHPLENERVVRIVKFNEEPPIPIDRFNLWVWVGLGMFLLSTTIATGFFARWTVLEIRRLIQG